MYYAITLTRAILALPNTRMCTNDVVAAVKCSKEGWLKRMRKYNVSPCEIVRSRGPFGTFIWDIKQVKKALKACEANI